jgi:hypothetical protein
MDGPHHWAGPGIPAGHMARAATALLRANLSNPPVALAPIQALLLPLSVKINRAKPQPPHGHVAARRTRREEQQAVKRAALPGCVRGWCWHRPQRCCCSWWTAAPAPCTRWATSTPGACRRPPSPTSTSAGPSPSTSLSATPSVSSPGLSPHTAVLAATTSSLGLRNGSTDA